MTAMTLHLQAPVGVGSPEGVVTAPVGSIYTDTAATNGAIRWIKQTGAGATGWRVLWGDTGYRDLSSRLINGWAATAANAVRIRRIKDYVTLDIAASVLDSTDATSNVLIADLGVGWRTVRNNLARVLSYSPTGWARLFLPGTAGIVFERTGWTGLFVAVVQETYLTADPWPTTLP